MEYIEYLEKIYDIDLSKKTLVLIEKHTIFNLRGQSLMFKLTF